MIPTKDVLNTMVATHLWLNNFFFSSVFSPSTSLEVLLTDEGAQVLSPSGVKCSCHSISTCKKAVSRRYLRFEAIVWHSRPKVTESRYYLWFLQISLDSSCSQGILNDWYCCIRTFRSWTLLSCLPMDFNLSTSNTNTYLPVLKFIENNPI